MLKIKSDFEKAYDKTGNSYPEDEIKKISNAGNSG